ncbi:transmembrane protein, putative (macronuclear) [Tetrahymena thermophila SB210]|uniref:Transmembrane protein, putative n=1 Tax=Tetrahymena thermophila (strain SB210) TaxID=312017 RepID=I7LZU9_TETTS|nr:transmembrane protein, putative [Tetrahymena thermophila SB210]EAR84957.2 transmembrane protein, putative [Tetrahymena thermophila SB210]|eukprot:XP_001032620.2 transmembrane protein, putative [Tetrahymena thermophila SB210]
MSFLYIIRQANNKQVKEKGTISVKYKSIAAPQKPQKQINSLTDIKMFQNYLEYKQRFKQINQSPSSSEEYDLCINSSNTSVSIFVLMIISVVLISTFSFSAILFLYKQRYKYPIAERSYMLSMLMCISFFGLSMYYPTVYILIHESTINEDILYVLKWIYIWSMFSLYFGYFARSLRIYSAFTNLFTCCIDSQHLEDSLIRPNSTFQYKPPSKIVKFFANILRNELLVTIIVFIVSILTCLPLVWNRNGYYIPIQNFDYYSQGRDRDFATMFIYLSVSFFFMLQLHLLRNVPKHYRFYQESLWNLGTNWLKATVLFAINVSRYDDKWCDNTYLINIILDYFQYLFMIIVSVIPALFRSMYIAEKTPYPILDKFYDFIEDEGDHNKMYCNISFIYFLNQKDQQINKQTAQQQRMNLNIYDFYKRFKTIQIQIDSSKQNQKLYELSNEFILNPSHQIKRLILPQGQAATQLQNFRNKYANYEYSQENQNEELFMDLENILGICTQYLIRMFEEYKLSMAFNYLVHYYKQQQIYQVNLSYFQLNHSN